MSARDPEPDEPACGFDWWSPGSVDYPTGERHICHLVRNHRGVCECADCGQIGGNGWLTLPPEVA